MGIKKALAKLLSKTATTYVILIAMLAVMLAPIVFTAMTSLKTRAETFQSPPTYWPQNFTLEAYREVIFDSPMPRHLFNSLVVAGGTTIIVMCGSVFTAWGLSRYRFRGSAVFFIYLHLHPHNAPHSPVGALLHHHEQAGPDKQLHRFDHPEHLFVLSAGGLDDQVFLRLVSRGAGRLGHCGRLHPHRGLSAGGGSGFRRWAFRPWPSSRFCGPGTSFCSPCCFPTPARFSRPRWGRTTLWVTS